MRSDFSLNTFINKRRLFCMYKCVNFQTNRLAGNTIDHDAGV